MDIVKELAVKWVADMSGLNASIKRMDDAVDKSTKNIKDKYGALINHMQTIGARMALGITGPLITAGGAALKFAVDAQESENLFEVSMGNMAGAARAWSNEMGKSLGLNAYEVRKNVGTFNVMLNSMGLAESKAYDMSKGMTKLAYDMASFYNLSNEEAFEKLSSGLSGEMEPLKRLGILVDEETVKQYAYRNGLAKTGEALTQTQKITARYGVIMQQTSKAQGDLARTADSPANQLKRLKNNATECAIQFGELLIPTLQRLTSIALAATNWLRGLDDGQRQLALGAAVVVGSIGPLVMGFVKVINVISATRAAVTALGWTMKTTFATGGYVAAIIALIAVLAKLGMEMYNVTKGAEDMAEAQWQAAQAGALSQGRPQPNAYAAGILQHKWHRFLLPEEAAQPFTYLSPEEQREAMRQWSAANKRWREDQKRAARADRPNFSVGAKPPTGGTVKVPSFKVGKESGGKESADTFLADQREAERQAAAELTLADALKGQDEATQTYIRAQREFNDTMRDLDAEARKGADVDNRALLAIRKFQDAHAELIKARADAVAAAKEKAAADKAVADQKLLEEQITAYQAHTNADQLLADLKVAQLNNAGKTLEAAYAASAAKYTKTLRDASVAMARGEMDAENYRITAGIAGEAYKTETQAAYKTAKDAAEAKRKADEEHTRTLAQQVQNRVQTNRRGYNEMVKDAWEAAKRMADAAKDSVRFVTGEEMLKDMQLRRAKSARTYTIPEPFYLNENAAASGAEAYGALRDMVDENRQQNGILQNIQNILGGSLDQLRTMTGEA